MINNQHRLILSLFYPLSLLTHSSSVILGSAGIWSQQQKLVAFDFQVSKIILKAHVCVRKVVENLTFFLSFLRCMQEVQILNIKMVRYIYIIIEMMVVCMILYSISIMPCYHYHHHYCYQYNHIIIIIIIIYHYHDFHIHLFLLLIPDNDQAASFRLIDATLGERKLGPSVAVDSYGIAVGITNVNPFDVRNPHPRYYQHHHYPHYQLPLSSS